MRKILKLIRKLTIVFLLLTSFSSFNYAQNKTFIVSYGANDAPPYAIVKKDKLFAGIIKDIFDAIVKDLDIKVKYVQTPRKRAEIYLASGKINAIAISNPQWLHQSNMYQWSDAIFVEKDLLVTLIKHQKKITKIAEMTNMIIGTTRGYKYPTLTKAFSDKRILRSDATNIAANFARLKLARIDGFIDSNILIKHHLTNLTLQHDTPKKIFQIEPIIISEHFIHTALSSNSPVSASQFNNALHKLKKNGTIHAILKKYGV
ncbi:MAG: hypothetical protein COB35_09300 [Gammaproteobacteria bacterium]|nr:MAG: hypothetical protein COB35_09300 [Gammaproteobacteria bacterium]